MYIILCWHQRHNVVNDVLVSIIYDCAHITCVHVHVHVTVLQYEIEQVVATCKINSLYVWSCVYQFDRFDPDDGRISELDFAKLVLSSTYLNKQAKKKYYKRIKGIYGTDASPVSWEQHP